MEWSSTAINWDMQIMIMWVILPPVFIISGFLTLILPRLLAQMQNNRGRGSERLSRQAVPEISG